jgi:hypothetical protein
MSTVIRSATARAAWVPLPAAPEMLDVLIDQVVAGGAGSPSKWLIICFWSAS